MPKDITAMDIFNEVENESKENDFKQIQKDLKRFGQKMVGWKH